MNDLLDIALQTYRPQTEALDDADAAFLASRMPRKIRITRHPTESAFVLDSRQYTGVVVLPSGRRIVSHPSIADHAVMGMLAVATDVDVKLDDATAGFDRLDDIIDFLANYFADLVDERVRAGLHRQYVEEVASLALVRGRPDFLEDSRQNPVLHHRLVCRYSDYTWDVADNQVLLQVATLLSGWRLSRRVSRQRLTQLVVQLSELSRVTFSAASVRAFEYGRLNSAYRPVHRLAALLLENAAVSETSGNVDFRTFLVDMNRLFEVYVAQVLEACFGTDVVVQRQRTSYLDVLGQVEMRPDLLLRGRGATAIADTKYKRRREEEHKNQDYYQMVAYCVAGGCRVGVLIYPRVEAAQDAVVRVANTELRIITLGVELRGGPKELRADGKDLARRLTSALDAEAASLWVA